MLKEEKVVFWQSFDSFFSQLKQKLLTNWRYLLILLIAVYLPLQIFILLAIEVSKTKGGFVWEVPILLAIHQIANPTLDILATKLTGLGLHWGILPIAILIGLLLSYKRRWQLFFYWSTTLLGSALISYSNKILWHRLRPELWQSFYPHPPNYSFPSGHAMATMTFIITLGIITWETRWRWLVLSLGSLFILAIAWTRLYLGVHYPSDILAGWMLAIAWTVGIKLLQRFL